ncbi:MAG: flippase-like domain-containing protein [Propionivibrio sp.]|uniref:Flippase-like domain-containing protein n=1 Tax=Candidatus Propionivibrio dominans TaxID=2954373 RepID=A0A9D7I697_9RHOO|nr:flippase-like domain-containing protein [Candidatus Propionivibrio dominans]
MKLSIRFLGFFLGAFFLIWSFSLVNWESFFLALSSMNPFWIVLSAASIFISMLLRSVRWHVVTGLLLKDHSKVWEATCIGYLGTAIYPARAGDVMRMLRLQQLTGLGGGLAIGSGVIDRIIEGLGLCGLLLVLMLSWKVGLEASQGLIVVAFLFFAAAVGATVFVLSGHRLQGLIDRLSMWGKWGVHLKRWYEQSLAGLQVLRSPRRLILAFSMQGLVSLFDVLACWLLIRSFGWTLPLMVGAVVLVYIAAAASLPSSPGYVGVYQIATLFALRPYGIDESSSVAYGTVLQVLTLILFICSGSWAFLKQRARNHQGKFS